MVKFQKRFAYFLGIHGFRWNHDYSKGWAVEFGKVVRGQGRLKISWVIHKKEYRGWM